MWAVDWILHMATLGVKRSHFHNGVGFYYSIIAPVAYTGTTLDDGLDLPDRPHIMPIYHAFLIVGEAVGTTKQSYVVELNFNEVDLTGYAIYEQGKLKRIVVINSKIYVNGTRSEYDLNIDGWGQVSSKSASVKYFLPPATESKRGL
jgi:hypothetical protein